MYWIKIGQNVYKITKKEFKILNEYETKWGVCNKDEVIKRLQNIINSSTPVKNCNKYIFQMLILNKIFDEYQKDQSNRKNY